MNPTVLHEELVSFLDDIIASKTDDSTITVIPLRCGLGKSTYLESLIKRRIDSSCTDGMIIVTDNIERLSRFISDNQKSVCMLTADNISEEIRLQAYKPILLMTTQRFFNLTRDEVSIFLQYQGGVRTEIIFDEKPYLYEYTTVTIETFNDVDTALQQYIDDTANQNEKNWCIGEWQQLRQHIQQQMTCYEKLAPDRNQFYLFHVGSQASMTSDDARFFKFVAANKNALNKYRSNIYKSVLAVYKIITEGAIFACSKRSSGKYQNYFALMLDNTDKLLNLGAKVFIFDGTADISPMYDGDYIDLVECSQFNPSLNNLTINCVDASTSKSELCSNRQKAKQTCAAILSYIERLEQNEPPVIFTYSDVEKFFSGYQTEHFGNIKGRNDFNQSHNIIQIGLNRFPPLVYFLQRSVFDDAELEMMKSQVQTIEQNISVCTKCLTLNSTVPLDTKVPNFDIFGIEYDLLEDFEQNLYRSAIRNIDNTDNVTYTIFFNTNAYYDLVELLRWRYGSLGATINLVETPTELQLLKISERKAEKPTQAQQILAWVNSQPKGTIFKLQTMLSELELSSKQFDKVKSKNTGIAQLFKVMATGSKGYYKT